MGWWQIVLVCWFCYIAGFFTAALMQMARFDTDDEVEPYRAGLNDD